MMEELVEAKAAKLAQCGLEDLDLKPDHLLISFDAAKLVLDAWESRKCACATLNLSDDGLSKAARGS